MTPTTLQCAGRPAPAATSVAVRICVSAIGRLVRLAQLSLGAPPPPGAAAAAETIAAHAVVASRLARPTPNCRRQPARISMSPSQFAGPRDLICGRSGDLAAEGRWTRTLRPTENYADLEPSIKIDNRPRRARFLRNRATPSSSRPDRPDISRGRDGGEWPGLIRCETRRRSR